MCGRYTLPAFQEQLAEEFELVEADLVRPRFNIAPTQFVPVVRLLEEKGRRQLDDLRWGLIPHWAKDSSIGSRMINARSEEASSKPAFRVPLRRQRCLVPCTGFFKWKELDEIDARRTPEWSIPCPRLSETSQRKAKPAGKKAKSFTETVESRRLNRYHALSFVRARAIWEL